MEDLGKASEVKCVGQDDAQITEELDESSKDSTAVAVPKVQTCPKPKTTSNPELRRRISVSSEEEKEFRVPADKPSQLGKRRTPLKSAQARIQPSKTSDFASPSRANLKRPASASASPSSSFIRPHAEKEGEVKLVSVEPKDKDAVAAAVAATTSKSNPPVPVEGFEAKILEHPILYLKDLSQPSKLQEPNVNLEYRSVIKIKDREFAKRRASTDSALDNSEVLPKVQIKAIDSELCPLIDQIDSFDAQLEMLRGKQVKEEKEWRAILSALKDSLKSLKENDSKPSDLNENERFNRDLSDEYQRVLELQISLRNIRKQKSYISLSIEVLQTKRSNSMDHLEDLLCRRLKAMRNLHKSESMPGSGEDVEITTVTTEGKSVAPPEKELLDQDVEILTETTEGKSVSPSKNKLLMTNKRLRESLPLLEFNPESLKSNWIAISDKETKEERKLVKEFCKMRSTTAMMMDRAKSIVSKFEKSFSILEGNITKMKSHLLKTCRIALVLGGINEDEIETFKFLEAGRPDSGALKQMDASYRDLLTQIAEIRGVHLKSCARLTELCDTDLAKTAVEDVVSWMDSMSSSIQKESSVELDLKSHEEQTPEAYSELLSFLKTMGDFDSQITTLYHKVRQHASQKSALSQKLVGCIFNDLPEVANKNPELPILECEESMNNFEVISNRMQHSRNMSRMVEYSESINECELELSNRIKSLCHRKLEKGNLFKQEFPSKFLPAACLDALSLRKMESMERYQFLGKCVWELMAGLEVLHRRNVNLIANVMKMLSDRQSNDSSEVIQM